MLRKLKMTLALALASVLASLGLTATPAQAAWSDCSAAYFCIYNGTGGTGLMYSWTVGYIKTLPDNCLNLTGSQNNMASSVYYNGSFLGGDYISVYSEPPFSGGTGRSITSNGYQDSNLGAAPGITGFNNTMSSICVH